MAVCRALLSRIITGEKVNPLGSGGEARLQCDNQRRSGSA